MYVPENVTIIKRETYGSLPTVFGVIIVLGVFFVAYILWLIWLCVKPRKKYCKNTSIQGDESTESTFNNQFTITQANMATAETNDQLDVHTHEIPISNWYQEGMSNRAENEMNEYTYADIDPTPKYTSHVSPNEMEIERAWGPPTANSTMIVGNDAVTGNDMASLYSMVTANSSVIELPPPAYLG